MRSPRRSRPSSPARSTNQETASATGAVAVDYVKGACLLMTRDALDEVGPLDEHGSFQYLFKLSCVVLEKDLWPAEAQQAGLSPEDFDFSR